MVCGCGAGILTSEDWVKPRRRGKGFLHVREARQWDMLTAVCSVWPVHAWTAAVGHVYEYATAHYPDTVSLLHGLSPAQASGSLPGSRRSACSHASCFCGSQPAAQPPGPLHSSSSSTASRSSSSTCSTWEGQASWRPWQGQAEAGSATSRRRPCSPSAGQDRIHCLGYQLLPPHAALT